MSEENIEVVRALFEANQAGDGEVVDAALDPDVEWAELTELIDAGENVVGVLHEKTGIGGSDDFVERDLFHVWTHRDGLVVKWRVFATREQALEAAGLAE
jgi:ketosteroid isomerase-like protein